MEIKNFNQFVTEGKKGIHPAVRKHLLDFFKKHKEGTFEQAKKYIKSKMKTWELSQDDYKEAKSLNEAFMATESGMTLQEKMERAYEQLGEILDSMGDKEIPAEYEDKAYKVCSDIQVLHYNMISSMEETDEEEMEGFEMPTHMKDDMTFMEEEEEEFDEPFMGEDPYTNWK